MNRTVLIALLLALSLIGLGDSWYLADSAISGDPLVCDIGGGLDGCNIVAQSPYSKIYGIPLAEFGVAFYALLFAASAVLLFFPRRLFHVGIFALTAVGALASVAFLYIQFVLIQAVCIYCILSAVVAFLAFGIAFWLWRRYTPALPVVVP